jgi:hypothetical protein
VREARYAWSVVLLVGCPCSDLRAHGLGPPSGSVNWKRREHRQIRRAPRNAEERVWARVRCEKMVHAVTAFNDLRASDVLEFNGT